LFGCDAVFLHSVVGWVDVDPAYGIALLTGFVNRALHRDEQ
jgi:hypothetical protein